MSKKVFLLRHQQDINDGEDQNYRLIGVFSTKNKAENMKDEYKKVRGFKKVPENLFIEEWILNDSAWREGFFTYYY